jgi:asparagine synthase (glutamine-hydrolysing)
MLRYFAVAGDTDQAPGPKSPLPLVLQTKGLRVWSSTSGERLDSTTVVLGKLFKRDTPGPSSHPLLKEYWGRYVALGYSEITGRTWVLRDPSGGVPCFFASHRGALIFFSHLEDVPGPFSLNWNYLAAYLVDPYLRHTRTGLNEVSEVLQGEYVQIEGSNFTRSLLWDPLKIAATDPLEDPATAIQEVRATISSCVAAWASSYKRIVHRISGGLDSSIVLACLSQALPSARYTCITRYDRSLWGDEREFARLATEHVGCELVERLQDVDKIDFDAVLAPALSPSPTWYVLNYTHHCLYGELSADAVFSGSGGDSIFFREPGEVLPVADYLYRHPWGVRLGRVAYDTALAHQRALWNLLPAAFLHGLLRRPFDVLHDVYNDVEFVNADVMANVKRSGLLTLPWLKRHERVPPGKLCHIHRMYMPDWPQRPYATDRSPDDVSPLLSQPVVELFLRIPTYLLIAGGRDRMLARRAFAQDLPLRLIARSSKGGQNSFGLQVLRRNEKRIRELLLDGRLCREGLLNRRKMEAVLASDYDSNTTGLMEILHTHLSAEIWLHRMASQLSA